MRVVLLYILTTNLVQPSRDWALQRVYIAMLQPYYCCCCCRLKKEVMGSALLRFNA